MRKYLSLNYAGSVRCIWKTQRLPSANRETRYTRVPAQATETGDRVWVFGWISCLQVASSLAVSAGIWAGIHMAMQFAPWMCENARGKIKQEGGCQDSVLQIDCKPFWA